MNNSHDSLLQAQITEHVKKFLGLDTEKEMYLRGMLLTAYFEGVMAAVQVDSRRAAR